MVCSMGRIVFPVIFSKRIGDFPLPPNDTEDKAWSSSFRKDTKQRQFCFPDPLLPFFFVSPLPVSFCQGNSEIIPCYWPALDTSSLGCRGQNTDAPTLGGTHAPWLSKSGLEMLKKTIVLKAGEEKENVHEGLTLSFQLSSKESGLAKAVLWVLNMTWFM